MTDEVLADIDWMKRELKKKSEKADILGLTHQEVYHECNDAIRNWPPFNSAHEGFAVLKEEVDELWDQVKINQKKRDINAMKKRGNPSCSNGLKVCG